MMRAIQQAVACVAVLTAAAGQVQAGLMFFSDRASFDAVAGTLSGFESFESSFPPGPSRDFGPFTATETGDTTNYLFQSSGNPTDGSRSLGYIPETTASVLTYSFDSPINAFGFDIANNFTGSTITVGGDVSTTFTINGPNAPVFFGVINDMGSFDTLRFTTDTINGNMQMDSVSFGNADVSAVPEPASLALWSVLGLVGVGCAWRRRRKLARS